MSISSDEAKEKQLVEKAELRLAIADSPQKFETNLQTFASIITKARLSTCLR